MPLDEYTLKRLADYWIGVLKDAGRKEAWKVRHGEASLEQVKEKHKSNVAHFFNELAENSGDGTENINESFDEVYAKARRMMAGRT